MRSAALGAAGVLAFLAFWQLAPAIGLVDGRYVPPASAVLARLVRTSAN